MSHPQVRVITDRFRYGSDVVPGLGGLGGFNDLTPEQQRMLAPYIVAARIVQVVSAAARAYHGYERNNGSIGWALGWGALGAIFPIVTPVVAVVQGYAKPAKRSL